MARYIDAENMYKEVWKRSTSPLNEWDTWGVLNALDMVKTEDVAPVIHAHWRWMLNHDVICSKCQYVLPSGSPVSDFRFCPHCGAKMDEKEGKK